MARACSGSRSCWSSVEPLMSANRAVTVLRSPSNSADAWSAVLWLIDSGNSSLAMGRRGDPAPGDDFSGPAHSPQKRAAGEFSNPHFAQRCLNGAAHCSQNFSPSGFSAPHFEQRIATFALALVAQFLEQRLGVLQIGGVEALSEPV